MSEDLFFEEISRDEFERRERAAMEVPVTGPTCTELLAHRFSLHSHQTKPCGRKEKKNNVGR